MTAVLGTLAFVVGVIAILAVCLLPERDEDRDDPELDEIDRSIW